MVWKVVRLKFLASIFVSYWQFQVTDLCNYLPTYIPHVDASSIIKYRVEERLPDRLHMDVVHPLGV